MLRALLRLALLGSLMTLAAAGVAWAHVEISPNQVRSGDTHKFVAEVPNESDVPYTKLEIRVPGGFEVEDASAPAGFEVNTDGNSITWSGGEVPAEESEEFTFEARVSGEADDYAFEAIQTYKDGEVIEWTGTEDSDEPAPVVTISTGTSSGAEDEPQHGDSSHSEDSGSGAESMPVTGGVSLGTGALVLGGALVVCGLLVRVRRSV